MASHFQWYADSPQVTPWNARYTFPTQANKATIVTPRISPKNGGEFAPGNVIRVEFPAQGYVNPANTFLEFDLTLSQTAIPAANSHTWLRLQNNVNSIFSRVRLMYGSTPLEDIIDYNQIVRNLTEWTATSGQTHDQTSIGEGIGGASQFFQYGSANYLVLSNPPLAVSAAWKNVRQASIQGIDSSATGGLGLVPNAQTISGGDTIASSRRYQVSFALGLFTQQKLIPTKYMASQLAIELTLAPMEECLYNGGLFTSNTTRYTLAAQSVTPRYTLTNVNLIPEILEFDSSYDASILKGLSTGGVPIKFSSWHTYQFTATGSSLNLQIQERSRSVKSIYTIMKRAPAQLVFDAGATLFMPVLDHTLQNYQYRIGGKYYPASPVQTALSMNSRVANGGAEAYCELQKALNIVGDYRLSAGVNSHRFGLPVSGSTATNPGTRWVTTATAYAGEAEMDYDVAVMGNSALGTALIYDVGKQFAACVAGGLGSACFAMATSLESSNGMEVAGLNAEEQSDIMLIANYSTPIPAGYNMEVFTYYDAMLVLKENNTIVLVQ